MHYRVKDNSEYIRDCTSEIVRADAIFFDSAKSKDERFDFCFVVLCRSRCSSLDIRRAQTDWFQSLRKDLSIKECY